MSRSERLEPNQSAWAHVKTPGDVFAATMAELYDRHDEDFLTLVREVGASTDELLAATEDLFDGLRQVLRGARASLRAAWRQQVASFRLRPMLVQAIRRRRGAEAN